MALEEVDVCFHLKSTGLNKVYYRRIVPATVESAKRYLINKYGQGQVILHYAEPVKEPVYREVTCRYCRHTHLETQTVSKAWHPATLNQSLWVEL